jgi:hypothetical protein
MTIYRCDDCDHPIQGKTAKFCTQCGIEISKPVPPEYLIDGKLEHWNITLLSFWLIWEFGAIATLFNSVNGNSVFASIGAVALVAGGIYITKSGSIKDKQSILIECRN